MDVKLILSIVAIVVAAAGLMWHQFGVLSGIKERLTRIETKVDFFWRMIEEKLSGMLFSPANQTKDELLIKLKERALSCEEAKKLKEILEGESQSNEKRDLTLAYFLVITRLEVLIEDFSRRR